MLSFISRFVLSCERLDCDGFDIFCIALDNVHKPVWISYSQCELRRAALLEHP